MGISVRDKEQIIEKLNEALFKADAWVKAGQPDANLSEELVESIITFSNKIDQAKSAFTNIITCLISKAVSSNVDCRYHRDPSEASTNDVERMPLPPSGREDWFSGRTISEKVIYPWLDEAGLRTAKSGWQTRTFERPKPYLLNYPENIAFIKNEFLFILDRVQNHNELAIDVVAYFFYLEILHKNKTSALKTSLTQHRANNSQLILNIVNAFGVHFDLKQSARLPVLAIYATYQCIFPDINRYKSMSLEELSRHEAADIRTGSVGDIEIFDQNGNVFEAVEVKHNIKIDDVIVRRAKEKVTDSTVERYYILTTHKDCMIDDAGILRTIVDVFQSTGKEIIVNGVIPTIKYYLRLSSNPMAAIECYTKLLCEEPSITKDQLSEWQNILSSLSLHE